MTSAPVEFLHFIREAIQGAGGPAKVARECSVSVQAVCFWRDGHRALPAEHCITLEKLNEGRVRCEQMLPNVDWAYLRQSSYVLAAKASVEAPHV